MKHAFNADDTHHNSFLLMKSNYRRLYPDNFRIIGFPIWFKGIVIYSKNWRAAEPAE